MGLGFISATIINRWRGLKTAARLTNNFPVFKIKNPVTK